MLPLTLRTFSAQDIQVLRPAAIRASETTRARQLVQNILVGYFEKKDNSGKNYCSRRNSFKGNHIMESKTTFQQEDL